MLTRLLKTTIQLGFWVRSSMRLASVGIDRLLGEKLFGDRLALSLEPLSLEFFAQLFVRFVVPIAVVPARPARRRPHHDT